MKKTPSEAFHEFLEAIGIGRLCHWLAPRLPVSRLDCLNRFFLQWLCCRVGRVKDRMIVAASLTEVSAIMGGGHGVCMSDCKYENHEYFLLMWWIKPLSGYGCPYKYMGKPQQRKISKVKKTPIDILGRTFPDVSYPAYYKKYLDKYGQP